MSLEQPSPNQPQEEFFRQMDQCFTAREWAAIRSPEQQAARLEQFMLNWVLKESYIKAVGIGLGLELQRMEFRIPASTPASSKLPASFPTPTSSTGIVLFLDSLQSPGWRFEQHKLDSKHVVAIAYGPYEDAVQSYRDTIKGIARHERKVEQYPGKVESFKEISFKELIDGMR